MLYLWTLFTNNGEDGDAGVKTWACSIVGHEIGGIPACISYLTAISTGGDCWTTLQTFQPWF